MFEYCADDYGVSPLAVGQDKPEQSSWLAPLLAAVRCSAAAAPRASYTHTAGELGCEDIPKQGMKSAVLSCQLCTLPPRIYNTQGLKARLPQEKHACQYHMPAHTFTH